MGEVVCAMVSNIQLSVSLSCKTNTGRDLSITGAAGTLVGSQTISSMCSFSVTEPTVAPVLEIHKVNMGDR